MQCRQDPLINTKLVRKNKLHICIAQSTSPQIFVNCCGILTISTIFLILLPNFPLLECGLNNLFLTNRVWERKMTND